MKGLLSNISNTLKKYKSTIHIKNRDVLAASRAAANCASPDDSSVDPEITNNSDDQDESDRHNVFRLAASSIKEEITEGITKIVGRDITNPILWTTDDSNFKSVDQYQIHHLLTAIKEGAEIPDSTNIRRQFLNITGTIFDWKEAVVTNVD